MSEHNYDVIIIGGGPARLFAGIACARNELRTLVLEKQTYPIDKACGEGIMPLGVNNFKKLGVAHFPERSYSQLPEINNTRGHNIFTTGFID